MIPFTLHKVRALLSVKYARLALFCAMYMPLILWVITINVWGGGVDIVHSMLRSFARNIHEKEQKKKNKDFSDESNAPT